MELFNAFAAGFDGELSETDQSLIRQAATLSLKSELLAADLAAGKNVDADVLIRLAGAAKRTLAEVSAASAASKPRGGDALQAYLAKRAAAAETDDTDED